ncbi:MAG: zinc-binding dehydrogenase [Verrucomicrobia bacterium]|nr:zinc-binding dehydrogenase [Verrucomicrobiota bacterium]
MKTKAALLVRLNQPLEIREISLPALKRGQVLVKMAYAGLCHSQLNEWKGTKGPDPYLPHTLGHEGSGIVLDVGEGVTKVKPGDHVVLSWIKGSGIDVPNANYLCEGQNINSGAISTFLEKAVISENRLIPIPSDISLKEAALLGCAIPTGAGVVMNDMQVQSGQSIAVFGIGGIGLSAILAAKFMKANPIVAIDVHEEKLERALQMGATHAIHAIKENVKDKIIEIFKGKGADFALESAGRKEVMEMAFEAVRPSGGYCVLAGNLPKGDKIQIDPFDLIRGKKIVGTWGGSTQIDRDVPRYAQLFIKEDNLLKPMISHEVRLDEINHLMQLLDKGLIARGLVNFT